MVAVSTAGGDDDTAAVETLGREYPAPQITENSTGVRGEAESGRARVQGLRGKAIG